MPDTLKDIYGTEMPYTQYNTLGVIASAAPATVVGVDAMIKANKAKKQLKIQQGYVDTLMTQYMNTPIYNPYKNVGVATKAAQMQVEETDKALANTLDTLRATGAAAGGATALAQAALKSKLGVSADIEKQEVANKQLEAKGEFMVQQAEMSRKGEQMDYEQSKADQLRTEQFAYQERASDMAGTLGSLGLEASRGLTIGKGNDQTTIPSPEGEVDNSTYLDDEGYLKGPGDEYKLTMKKIDQDPDASFFYEDPDVNKVSQDTSRGQLIADYAKKSMPIYGGVGEYRKTLERMQSEPNFGFTPHGTIGEISDMYKQEDIFNPFYDPSGKKYGTSANIQKTYMGIHPDY